MALTDDIDPERVNRKEENLGQRVDTDGWQSVAGAGET
jgi:hypothetical protein